MIKKKLSVYDLKNLKGKRQISEVFVNNEEEAIAAEEAGIDIRHYSIIYDAIEEVKLALEGLLEPEKVEEVIGVAEVRDQFKIPKLGIIAGCMVVSGKVVRNAFLRVRRDDEIVHEGRPNMLRRAVWRDLLTLSYQLFLRSREQLTLSYQILLFENLLFRS